MTALAQTKVRNPMSDKKAAFSILRRQRSYLKTWSRSVDAMIEEADKLTPAYWTLCQERDTVRKEIARINARFRMV